MRDTSTGIRVREITIWDLELPGVLVELTGELDVHDLEPLRRTFDDALGSGLPTYMDLSRVTFLDVRCALELAVQDRLYCIHDSLLVLRDPSWQAEASFRACGVGSSWLPPR